MQSTLRQAFVRGLNVLLIGLVGSCLWGTGICTARVQDPCSPLAEADPTWPVTPACELPERFKNLYTELRTPPPEIDRWLNRQLVGTTPKGRFRLALDPNFVDLAGISLLSLHLRFNYGITSKWSGGFRLRFYTENPFTNEVRSDPGIGDVLFETKYRLPAWRAQHLEAAVSLKVLVPVTHNENRSDGVVHVIPGLTLLRPMLRWPPLHVYTRVGLDIATGDIVRIPVADEIQETFFLGALGLIYPLPPVLIFFDVEWQTNVFIDGGDSHNFLVTPGIRYELPKLPHIPGLWNVELGLGVGFVNAQNLYVLGFRLFLSVPKSKTPHGGSASRAQIGRFSHRLDMGDLVRPWLPGLAAVSP